MDLPIFGGSQRAMTEHRNYLERSIYPNISLNNENLEVINGHVFILNLFLGSKKSLTLN